MKSKQEKLDELAEQIMTDKICPELAEQATQLVFGVGNPDAEVVFIGEAPGKNEDLKGEPFVGAAGKFLNEMLAMIGLQREDIYITNIVKYRPPNNRDPLPQEKAAFLPYLKQQLDIINPKLIITLGRHSMDVLLPSVPTCASCLAGGPPEQCSGRVNDEYRKDVVAEATTSAERNHLPGDVRSGGASNEQAGRGCVAPLKISQVHGEPKRIRRSFLGRAGHLGASTVQGTGEKRTEPYKSTVKGVSQPVTQQRAASDNRAVSSADGQVGAAWVILPLFHPAAALYNGGLRQTLIDDFARIPFVLDKLGASSTSESPRRTEPTFSSLDVAKATSHSEKAVSASPKKAQKHKNSEHGE